MDARYYIYDTTTRETTELGQILWRFAANENMVCFPSGKVYLAYDDCGHSAGNKIVEVDLLQSTVTKPGDYGFCQSLQFGKNQRYRTDL